MYTALLRELWVIGNGFNKALAQSKQFSEAASELDSIASLWSEFNELVGEVKKQLQNDTGQTYSDERVIEFIFTVLRALESKDIFQHSIYQGCFDKLFDKFSKALFEKLLSIALNFIKSENDKFYTLVSKLLGKDFLLHWQQRRKETPTTLITTNYDGIVDTIFARDADGYFGEGGMRDFLKNVAQKYILPRARKNMLTASTRGMFGAA